MREKALDGAFFPRAVVIYAVLNTGTQPYFPGDSACQEN